MPSVVPPFLIGIAVAPLAKGLLKPVLRGVVKGSVGLALEVRRAAAEVTEELQDLAAEASADIAMRSATQDEKAVIATGNAASGRSGTRAAAATR